VVGAQSGKTASTACFKGQVFAQLAESWHVLFSTSQLSKN